VFQRDRFGYPVDGVLAGNVDRNLRYADQSRSGRVVDDGPAAGFQHRRNLVLERQPNAFDVDVHNLVVTFFALIGKRRLHLLNAGVVEGKIEPAEGRQRLIDHRFDITRFRDVGFDEERITAEGLDLGDDFTAFLFTSSADDDLGSLFGELD